MKKYKITCNERQMRLMSDCLEDLCRFLSGQPALWNTTSLLEGDNGILLREELEKLSKYITPDLSKGSSYGWTGNGCPNKFQKQFIAEVYYLYRTMKYYLHKDNGMEHDVYHTPSLRCADSGEHIEIEEI